MSKTSRKRKIHDVHDDDFWTNEKCLELIQIYKDTPALWDCRDPGYFLQHKKHDTWTEIANKMNLTTEECKNKMRTILSSFRREKAKLMTQMRGGSQKLRTSNWFAFQALSFLLNKNSEKNTLKDKYSKKGVVAFTKLSKSGDVTYYGDLREIRELATPPAEPPKTTATETPVTKPATATSDDFNEILTFTNFIASKMRKYSEKTSNAVQEAICEILFKADRNEYDKVSCDSTSTMPQTSKTSIDPNKPSSSRGFSDTTSPNKKQENVSLRQDENSNDSIVMIKQEPPIFDIDSD